MQESGSKIEWISHRGLKEGATENTHAAFSAAVDHGFRVLETDLHATADQRLVLAHDPSFERLTGDLRPIKQMTSADIARLMFKDKSTPLFFDDFVRDFEAQDWVFDIKPTTAPQTLALLLAWSLQGPRNRELLQKTKFVVWTKRDALWIQEMLPGVIVFANQRQCYQAGLSVLARLPILGGIRQSVIYSLTPSLRGRSLFDPRLVEAYHQRGAKVLAFLPETEEQTRAAINAGFDLILTNGRIVPPRQC